MSLKIKPDRGVTSVNLLVTHRESLVTKEWDW
jgi:hypothetical protein